MKVICSKENLIEGINIVQKAVSTKTTLPILEGILLEAETEFKLTGNDLEIGIECYVEADIRKAGSIVLNSRMFGDIVRRMPDSDILIEVKENNMVVIECENSHFELKGLSPSGYPVIQAIQKDNALTTNQKLIRDMIRQTLFAVGVDENRPVLTGSLVECSDGILTFVSIDGFRLALRKNAIEEKDSTFKAIVPGKTLNEVSKILQPVEEQVTIYSSGSQIMFDMGKCKVVSRLLDGEYLNYRSIIPQDHETRILIHTKDLLSSIERASLIITRDEKRNPVKFNIVEDQLVISSNTELGNVREEIRVEMNGNNVDIGFNPAYFIECLRTVEDENVEIFFATSVGPCTIKPVGGEGYTYLIAAVRR